MEKSFMPMELQYFAEGTAAGAEGAGEGSPADAGQDMFEGLDAPTRKRFEARYQKVQEGKKAAEPVKVEKPVEQPAQPARIPLKDLLKDEAYKAEYQQMFQQNWNQRHGEDKGKDEVIAKQKQELESLRAFANRAAVRYNKQAGDIDGLNEAFDNDEGYLESEAMKRNTTAEMAKRELAIERRQQAIDTESQRIKAEREDMARRQQMAQQYQGWMTEGETFKQEIPSFDFETEANSNPLFFQLVRSGAPVRNAYMACHADEMHQAMIQQAANAAEEKTMNQVRSNLARPLENGVRPANANANKFDPKALTSEQRKKLFSAAHDGAEITADNMAQYLNR